MTKAEKLEIETRVRLNYPTESNSLFESDALVYKAGTKEQIIMSDKWWLNKNTPVGEDAELWKRMPWNGRRELSFNNIIAVYRESKYIK